MSHFLAVSAFRDTTPEVLAGHILKYAYEFGLECEEYSNDEEPDPAHDASLYSPQDGWTTILWPARFVAHDIPACRSLSNAASTQASTIHIVNDAYWTHVFFDRGRIIDQFCSNPDDNASNPEELAVLRRDWRGNPSALAGQVGALEDTIARYYLHASSARGKAFADDEATLQDIWVIVDFWRRLGIRYPDVAHPPERTLEFAVRFPNARLPIEGP